MGEPKYKEGDRVLVDVGIYMEENYQLQKKEEGTVKSFEGFGTYLVKLDKLEKFECFGGAYYFAEFEMQPLKEEKDIRSIEDLPISDEELEEFSLDMYFATMGWKIDNLLDKYNETGNKSYLKKCEEIMEG